MIGPFTLYAIWAKKISVTYDFGTGSWTESGSDYEHQTQYDFNGLNELKPQMVEVATRNAREVAQKFADDSGSKLGKIQTASQGQFSIYDRDSNTPWIKNVRVVTSVTYYLK